MAPWCVTGERLSASAGPTGGTHRVASKEIFEPVFSVMTFRTPEEAFERANNTPYACSTQT
jgi:acyl-CoA reductase-like NAD-dependent aldehyde dehydrogenase